jgi:4-hydroxy-3-methylbut-2-enyl diphosphate reductase
MTKSSLAKEPRKKAFRLFRADALGMCFGVKDALEMAQTHPLKQGLTILGPLVHNEQVNGALEASGIKIEKDLHFVETETVLITAHGVSKKRWNAIQGKRF